MTQQQVGGRPETPSRSIFQPSLPRVLRFLTIIVVATFSPTGVSAGRPLFLSSAVVKELTPEQFEAEVVNSPKAWFVDFYADWCPHCMHFAPVWESVAGKFKGDDRAVFGALDCAIHTDFCANLQIASYPTTRAFNLPSVPASSLKSGVDLHEGGYQVDEEPDLIMLLRGKMKGLGPGPAGEAPTTPLAASPAAAPPTPYPRPVEQPPSPRTAAQRLSDAEVALFYSLRQGTALAAARVMTNYFKPHLEEGDMALHGEVLNQLVLWLSFLSQVLPTTEAKASLRDLMVLAQDAQDTSGSLPRDAWLQALDSKFIQRIPRAAGEDPTGYWQLCTTYTCGLWTLFHMVTVSSLERGGGARGLEALVRIRDFVATFFGCAECAKHFLATYDDCKFGRCTLSDNDASGVALWLWEVHNNVTLRVAAEQGFPAPPSWPPALFCPTCWNTGGVGPPWSRQAVYDYLVRSYLLGDDVEAEIQQVSLDWREEDRSSWAAWFTKRHTAAVAITGAFSLVLLMYSMRHHYGREGGAAPFAWKPPLMAANGSTRLNRGDMRPEREDRMTIMTTSGRQASADML